MQASLFDQARAPAGGIAGWCEAGLPLADRDSRNE